MKDISHASILDGSHPMYQRTDAIGAEFREMREKAIKFNINGWVTMPVKFLKKAIAEAEQSAEGK